MRDGSQTSDTVLLVRPARFGFHADAAQSNAFAQDSGVADAAAMARAEFDGLRSALEDAGVRCLVLDDSADPAKPDAVFPNNWVSFHGDGTIIYYPMANNSRRLERRPDAIAALIDQAGLSATAAIDLSPLEADGQFVEGTGSLVLDRPARRAFACRSPRTTDAGLDAFAAATGWTVERFDAVGRDGQPIYHTNVLLSLGTRFALLCTEVVAPADRARVADAIAASGRTIIAVSLDQMAHFACNAIELRDSDGNPLVALSTAARDCLSPPQRAQLQALGGRLVAVPIPTIERIGGGSVRCMIAELPLPRAP